MLTIEALKICVRAASSDTLLLYPPPGDPQIAESCKRLETAILKTSQLIQMLEGIASRRRISFAEMHELLNLLVEDSK